MKRTYTPVKKKTILIVDNDQVVAHIYREEFQRQGFKVEVADNGESAMEKLRQDPVNLVILDLCLPDTNGLEVLENIRSEFDKQALPVIAFSNVYLGNLMRAASAAGATKCVSKAESTPVQILDLVRELLNDDHSNEADTTSKVVAHNAGENPVAQFATEFQQKLTEALRVNAPQTLARLCAGYRVLTRTEHEDLRQTELSEMHRQVHSLVGSTGLIGFRKIAQMANALEALLIELHAKPTKMTPSVVRTLGHAIDTLTYLTGEAMSTQPEVLEPPRILVVDDEIISRETICSALGKANLTAESVDDSLTAQHLLEHDCFDLIFLDVEMPGLSGLELCKSIRAMPTNRATPVVFVTAHSDFGIRAQSVLSGGNDFIAKPFLLVELAVKALTSLFRVSAKPLAAASAQNSSPTIAGSCESQRSADHAEMSVSPRLVSLS